MTSKWILEQWSIDLPQYNTRSTSSSESAFSSFVLAVNGYYEIEGLNDSRRRLKQFRLTGNYIKGQLPSGMTSFAAIESAFETLVGQNRSLIRVKQGTADREYIPARLISFASNDTHHEGEELVCSFVWESITDWAVLT